MEFPEYLERQFLQWQNQQGKRKSIAEFAAYLGVSQPLLSMWMNGSRKPARENLKILYAVFGPSVYDVLGLTRPNPLHEYVSRNWEKLPIKEQHRIREIVAKYTDDPLPNAKPARAAKT